MSFDSQAPSQPTAPNNAQSTTSAGGTTWNNSSGSSFTDPQTVWGAQSPFLQNLYQQGSDLAGNFGQQEQQAQGIYGQAMGAFDRLMNPGVNPQLDAYAGQVQQNLDRNIMPTIQGQAGGFGQMGGARQGVAEGIALGDANQQITDMSANLYNQDMDRMMQAASMAPGLANFGMGIPWYAQNQYSGLLGSPTILGGASGSESSASGGGSTFSESYSTDTGGGGGGGGGGFGFDIPFKL